MNSTKLLGHRDHRMLSNVHCLSVRRIDTLRLLDAVVHGRRVARAFADGPEVADLRDPAADKIRVMKRMG